MLSINRTLSKIYRLPQEADNEIKGNPFVDGRLAPLSKISADDKNISIILLQRCENDLNQVRNTDGRDDDDGMIYVSSSICQSHNETQLLLCPKTQVQIPLRAIKSTECFEA